MHNTTTRQFTTKLSLNTSLIIVYSVILEAKTLNIYKLNEVFDVLKENFLFKYKVFIELFDLSVVSPNENKPSFNTNRCFLH